MLTTKLNLASAPTAGVGLPGRHHHPPDRQAGSWHHCGRHRVAIIYLYLPLLTLYRTLLERRGILKTAPNRSNLASDDLVEVIERLTVA